MRRLTRFLATIGDLSSLLSKDIRVTERSTQSPPGNPAVRAEGSPRFYSRSLPILGVLVGVVFLVVLFLGGQITTEAPRLGGVLFKTPADGSPDPCRTDAQALTEAEGGELFLPVGPDPMHVLVTLPDAAMPDDLVLVLDSSVDRAGLRACNAERVSRAGDLIAFSERDIQAEDIAFALDPAAPGARFHLEMVQDAAISQRLGVMEAGAFADLSDQRLRIRLMAYGAVSIMIFYNLALSYFAGNTAFAFNAGVSFSMLVLDVYLSGFGPAYLWPEAPWLSQPLLAFGLAGPSLFGPFYLAHFLGEEETFEMGGIDYGWSVMSATLLLCAWFIVETPAYIALTANWIIMTAYYSVRVTILYRRGSERAAVLLFPLFGAVVPAMIAGSIDSWFQPDFGALQDHLTEMALILESLCFTLALAFLLRLARWREAEALRALNLQAEEAKQTLLTTLDADRSRMASELHDTAGQGLLFAISQLKRVEDPDARLQDVSRIVTRTLNDLRALSHDLHPSTLDHLGLEGALGAMVDHARASVDIAVDSDIDLGGVELAPASALHVYRIVQELLTNALVHSGGTKVTVRVLIEGEEITLLVEDDGVGAGTTPGSAGIGTTIIRERIQALRGKFWSVGSDRGTKVRAVIPVLPSDLQEISP